MSGMLRYLCATGTERILDNSSTKNLVVKSHFLLGSFICYYRIPVEWIQGLVRGVGATGAVLLLTDGTGDRPCPAQGAWYTCKGMKGGSSRNLD